MKFTLPRLFVFLFLISLSGFGQQANLPPAIAPTIQISKATEKIVIDGKLNEADWQNAVPTSSFKQVEPYQGTDAKAGTIVKMLFDEKNIYFGIFAKDSNARRNIRVPNLNRDFTFEDNDLFGIAIDPFNNKRNATAFQITPYGTQRDLQSFDDALFDTDWNTLWYVKTFVTDSGWYAEVAIPFQSIRYPVGNTDWGINFIRIHRSSNEISSFPGYPRSLDTYRMTYTASLVGIEVPKPGINLQVNPFFLQQAHQQQERDKSYVTKFQTKIGGDIKWAVSQHSVLDVTANTDFAQADVDRQVVNLTRFSVFYPERRQFFLENSGLLLTGDGLNIEPFFSRRIGLDDDGNPIPLIAGAKYTDRTVKRSMEVLYALQDKHDTIDRTNFSVLRYIHNYGNANNIGVMLTNKYLSDNNMNTVASLSGLHRVGEKWRYKYLWSQSFDKMTVSDTADKKNTIASNGFGGNINIDYASNKMYFNSNHSLISEMYLPGIGFISRSNLLTHSVGLIPIFRPKWKPRFMRSFQPGLYLDASQRASDLKMQEGDIKVYPVYLYFNDGSLISFLYSYNWQLLTEEIKILGAPISEGDYYYNRYKISYNTDLSKKVSISGKLQTGGYFNGQLTGFNAELKIAPIPNISFINSYEFNAFKNFGSEHRDFNTNLFTTTLALALNANIQLVSFYQYNSTSKSSRVNIRFSWQYRPLSYIYLVYNSNNNEFPAPKEQQGIFKINFLRQIR